MDLQTKLDNLPTSPGVYLMKNDQGQVIYVGKAINLRNRVRSYFRELKPDQAKTKALVKHIVDLEYILADNELEALVLECNLIKKYRPKYNINLKDDKTYPYLKITNEPYPQVIVTRKVAKDGARYYGPYPSVNELRNSLELIRKIFPFRSCKQRTFTNDRPCLNAHIHMCYAPCVGRISKEDYNAMIDQIALFFDGKQDGLTKRLRKEMEEAAENLEFEKAAKLRDQLQGIEQIITQQKAVLGGDDDRDVIAMARGLNQCCVQIFFIRGGKIVGRENYFLRGTDGTSRGEVIASFMKQFYLNCQFIPRNILIETELEEQEVLEQWLSDKRESRVYIKVPKRGQAKELIDLVGRNALDALTKQEQEESYHHQKTTGVLEQLQNMLGLSEIPQRMECFDISNTQGTESVGSMVVFVDGKAKKDQYRRFKIKTVEGADDYASMREVLTRRFRHGLEERQRRGGVTPPENGGTHSDNGGSLENTENLADTKFAQFPDIIMMDGGRGQVNIALDVLAELGLNIPVCGMVKDDRHRTRGLYYNNVELPIDADSELFLLITRMQDEAHRFAITYHRSLRGKRNLASVLDDIPGVGEKRKKNLLKHFGSFTKIKEASVEELMEVEGIHAAVAEEIYSYLRTHQDLQARLDARKKL
ncbi:MAG: excinuclease ABC subunit UvrC [Peptococcaceae bacterium]|nr:excinuclease ABC subunit UvrC [Peptococcaceae bacterium]